MRAFLHRNGLSVVTLTLFVLFWAAQAAVGFEVHNGDLEEHGRQALSLGAYLRSGHFWEATGENWESEFLQMAAFVVLTARLYQRGSAESNPLPEEQDQPGGEQGAPPTPPEQRPWPVRRGGWVLGLYSHSLSLTLLGLFLLSFVIHLLGGAAEYNTEQALHGGEAVSTLAFLGSPEFWSQSFQNWQSEFLSVAAMVILSIFLRERGSAESKDVEAPHRRTGG
ncbi:DUF6766 family protein [Deinococcus budaensis]|uniref:Transmembrane protein n=1 Tax=Deinococcus budaensis TaxID=1665626 RepID=A0A7W8GEE3_9DEIO|nr:DUF6766 family protein [Deinococcus budaensis]MBB5234054.1 hypothetical protein [Deinococcus budaensis]